jgi:hypothetical protein
MTLFSLNRNHEVLFRASNENGATLGDKINLSLMVSWWERNQTQDEPVMRISTDGAIYLVMSFTCHKMQLYRWHSIKTIK